ncbi:MAG: cytidine deaminase, partial [Psychromonas sp.]|nr:cytidine deaminase [Psychromonas sp.]
MENIQLQKALQALPENIADYIKPIVEIGNFSATISASQFEKLMSQTGLDDKQLRLALLPWAASYSISPISNFCVGAIARGISGRLYFGANIEFANSPLGQSVHAEQSAISHAWMKGETGIQDITINYSPCGHCRQFMNELNTAQTLMVQLPERDAKSLQVYLPESFGPKDLNIDRLLMDDKPSTYKINSDDRLLNRAVGALNISHAPYSGNYAGVAIKLDDNTIYSGAYAENAAFNPSLPALQVAIIQVQMAGKSFDHISAVALVELESGQIS